MRIGIAADHGGFTLKQQGQDGPHGYAQRCGSQKDQ